MGVLHIPLPEISSFASMLSNLSIAKKQVMQNQNMMQRAGFRLLSFTLQKPEATYS
jgi:hypothetical protein